MSEWSSRFLMWNLIFNLGLSDIKDTMFAIYDSAYKNEEVFFYL